MKIWLKLLVIAVPAAVATLASTVINSHADATYAEIMGCESTCSVAAVGWPVPYIVDYPGISPAHVASLTGAVRGLDVVWPTELAVTFFFWLSISSLWVGPRLARR